MESVLLWKVLELSLANHGWRHSSTTPFFSRNKFVAATKIVFMLHFYIKKSRIIQHSYFFLNAPNLTFYMSGSRIIPKFLFRLQLGMHFRVKSDEFFGCDFFSVSGHWTRSVIRSPIYSILVLTVN